MALDSSFDDSIDFSATLETNQIYIPWFNFVKSTPQVGLYKLVKKNKSRESAETQLVVWGLQ